MLELAFQTRVAAGILPGFDMTNLRDESQVHSPNEEIQDQLNLEFLTQWDEATEPKDEGNIRR